ncbi:unnamed protein product, partial [Meganyctiphanes norvegica]
MVSQNQFLITIMTVSGVLSTTIPAKTTRTHYAQLQRRQYIRPEQDTIFAECDYGVGGVGDRIDERGGGNTQQHNGISNSPQGLAQPQTPTQASGPPQGFAPPQSVASIPQQSLPPAPLPAQSQAVNPAFTQAPALPAINGNRTVLGRQPGCTVRPDPGECRGAFPRYYYNPENDQCDCFLFGGCDEEGVIFTWLRLEDCVGACVPGNREAGPSCQLVTADEVIRFII